MGRTVAGLVLVISTLVTVLVIGGLVGHSVDGSAIRAGSPAAPVPGSCVVLSNRIWRETACQEPHTGEVAAAWSAANPAPADLYQACMTASTVYLGSVDEIGSQWALPPVATTSTLVSGPGSSPVNGWSWHACVVRPIVSTLYTVGYRGSIAVAARTGTLPVELRSCFDLPDNVGMVGVPCTGGHLGETLAMRNVNLYGATDVNQPTDTDPAVVAQCAAIARRATGVGDPTFGGRLAVKVNLHAFGVGFVTSGTEPGSTKSSYIQFQASCGLQAAGPHRLFGSLIDVGGAPLPLR